MHGLFVLSRPSQAIFFGSFRDFVKFQNLEKESVIFQDAWEPCGNVRMTMV